MLNIMLLFWLLITVLLYWLTRWLQSRVHTIFVHPVLLPVLGIIGLLELGLPSLESFEVGTAPLVWLLGPAVVALGVKLHLQMQYLRKYLRPILISVFMGSLVGVASGFWLSHWAGAAMPVSLTMSTRSVTTPIAMAICEANGGLSSVAAGVVISTGIFGAVIGHWWLKLVGIREHVAQGLAMGSAAHGIGTARAFEVHEQQGTFSGLAFGLAGVFTSIIVPIFKLFV